MTHISVSISCVYLCASVNAHHKPWEVTGTLHAKGTDKEVEDRGDENHDGCYVVQVVQTLLQGGVVQVPAACFHTNTQIDNKKRKYFRLHQVPTQRQRVLEAPPLHYTYLL